MGSRYSYYEDAKLRELVEQKDTYAFEALYDRYWAPLYSFARKWLRDDDLAKDATQEIFIKLYERLSIVDLEIPIYNYLVQSLRRHILDMIRHEKVKSNHIASFREYFKEGVYQTDDEIRQKELVQLIELEIRNLPPKMRAIFELSRNQYLTHKQIAERIGVKEGTVKKQLHYAISRLRSKLGCMFWLSIMNFILGLNRGL